MRKTKPPVGWEHVKNCFPVPNILLDMDLPASAVAVYLYLLRSADRKTDQCHPSEATIATPMNSIARIIAAIDQCSQRAVRVRYVRSSFTGRPPWPGRRRRPLHAGGG